MPEGEPMTPPEFPLAKLSAPQNVKRVQEQCVSNTEIRFARLNPCIAGGTELVAMCRADIIESSCAAPLGDEDMMSFLAGYNIAERIFLTGFSMVDRTVTDVNFVMPPKGHASLERTNPSVYKQWREGKDLAARINEMKVWLDAEDAGLLGAAFLDTGSFPAGYEQYELGQTLMNSILTAGTGTTFFDGKGQERQVLVSKSQALCEQAYEGALAALYLVREHYMADQERQPVVEPPQFIPQSLLDAVRGAEGGEGLPGYA